MSAVMTQAESDLINAREASKLCGVSVRTLRRYADAGKITAYRTPGGTLRYRRGDVAALTTPITPA